MRACRNLINHFEPHVPYLSLSAGRHISQYCYDTRDKLHLVRIAQSDLSRHIYKMIRLYDTTSNSYENEIGFRNPVDFLNYDYQELKRKLQMLQAILGAVTSYIS